MQAILLELSPSDGVGWRMRRRQQSEARALLHTVACTESSIQPRFRFLGPSQLGGAGGEAAST